MPGIAAKLRLLGALVGVALLLAPSAVSAETAAKTLRVSPRADLRSIDPIWTTAYVTRNFGYLVFDTLFALDKDFTPQPQMVDKWTVSDDKLTYKITLRDGLKWHDGQPVRAADCVASIERWAKRDQFGQKMMEAVGSIKPDDDKSFTIALKAPFPLLISALGKLSSNVPFMMPERLAKTDAFQQIPEAIGSGPFKFVKEEWVPGSKAVFVKNAAYVPAKAKQLIQEAGYKGERIVLLSATDQPIVQQQALVTRERLAAAGLNIDLQANDWGTLITRRASKEPIDKGGWNLFHTWTAAPDMLSPALNIPLRANGDKAWFGWPKDPKLEELIDAWFKASDPAEQKKLAEAIQVEAYSVEIPYVPTGQFVVPTAYRKNIEGIITAPVPFLWNVEKK